MVPLLASPMLMSKNIFDDYQGIYENYVKTAKVARTNGRAIQNSPAIYKTLQNSITGDIKTQMFLKIVNIPSMEDGVSFFKYDQDLHEI